MVARQESRGGHTRDDFPKTEAEWGTKNLVLTLNATGDGVDIAEKPLPVMPDELKKYFEDSPTPAGGAAPGSSTPEGKEQS